MFLFLSSAWVTSAGLLACEKRDHDSSQPLVVGPLSGFRDGSTPLTMFRLQVVREGTKLRAVSLVCTHQTCLLTPTVAGFDCPCHGSTFSSNGIRLSGPAPRDLPWYALSVSSAGELLVHLDRVVGPETFLDLAAHS